MKSPTRKQIIIALGIVGVAILAIILMSSRGKECSAGKMSKIGYISTDGKDGDLCQSFLGNKNAPRGVRNNNVGNIIKTSSQWKGKIPHEQNDDLKFEQFQTYAHGIRAMIYTLDKNYIQQGRNTIDSIIEKYAENSSSYKGYLENAMGRGMYQQIRNSKTDLKNLVKAMARYENGANVILDSQFENAWTLYLPSK